jgi:phosphoribosyl-ATP pyrophosphohydrolase/phosphoribosyl-AMP cyclohydrolase
MIPFESDKVRYDANGLVPVIARDADGGEVLMLAYMNATTLAMTLETGQMHYWSRSRGEVWRKGATSGNTQRLVALRMDCDGDALLADVVQRGPACHTGEDTCFGPRKAFPAREDPLKALSAVIEDRRREPKEGSYTNYLFDKGLDKILKKVGEEAAEVIIAAKNRSADEIRYEAADLMYHLSVLLAEAGLTWDDIYGELERRR